MATHAAPRSHMAAAIVFGLVLASLVYLIFGFLSGNYTMMLPLLIAYAIWTVVSLFIYGRGLDAESAEHADAAHG